MVYRMGVETAHPGGPAWRTRRASRESAQSGSPQAASQWNRPGMA